MSQSCGVGTPPTGRRVSPAPRRRTSGDQRNSVVPFVRPGTSSKPSESQSNSLDKPGRSAFPPQPQARSVPTRSQSTSRCSFELFTPEQRSAPASSLPARPVDSPFSRQEGFATTSSSPGPDQDAALASAPSLESPGRTRSTSLLSQQLNREYSLALSPADVKRSLESCHGLPSAVSVVLKTSTDLIDLQDQYEVFRDITVQRAFAFAKKGHAGQQRRNGDPVFTHCVETAKILAELGLTAEVVAAGLLHDILDDTTMTEQQLRSAFSPALVDMVCKVSRISYICQFNRDQQENKPLDSHKLADTLMCMADPRCVLIKLADRLHNMRTITALPQVKRERMAQETMQIFSPLANRLGVWSLKAELEDLCFQQIHPEQHAQLQQKLKESQDRGSIENVLDQLSQRLNSIGLGYKELSGRPKNLWGVHNKMQQKRQELDRIYDLRAIRVIVEDKTDCYSVLRQVHKMWQPVQGRFKDYIKNPKENGYRSLHTVVVGEDGIPVEVQIRTAKMHFIAEHGLAAHWRYKERVSAEFDDSNYLADCHAGWARYVLTWQMHLTDSKVRPSGSPGRDTSMADLLGCDFPEHSSDCKFATYMNQIMPKQVSKEVASRYPINVFLTYSKSGVLESRLESLPHACTPAMLGTMLQTGLHNLGDVSPFGVRMLVNNQELTDPHQPLAFGDFVEVIPCERPKPVHDNVAPWYSGYEGYHLFPKPQMRNHKHRAPVEQQRQQLNSMYKLTSETEHSPTEVWRVSSTELTTPPRREQELEKRRPVAL